MNRPLTTALIDQGRQRPSSAESCPLSSRKVTLLYQQKIGSAIFQGASP